MIKLEEMSEPVRKAFEDAEVKIDHDEKKAKLGKFSDYRKGTPATEVDFYESPYSKKDG